MPNEFKRAKIFKPFDALKGFQELLRKKELELEEENIKKIINLKFNDTITIIDNNKIITKGKIKKIDYINKYIIINKTKINFINIKNIT